VRAPPLPGIPLLHRGSGQGEGAGVRAPPLPGIPLPGGAGRVRGPVCERPSSLEFLSPIGGEGRGWGPVCERPRSLEVLSPLGGEGRVRGQVCERPRKYARALRQSQTDAERKLWGRLRDRGLTQFKFRRQHPIGPFVADFCCTEAKLVIELDGGQHSLRRSSDAARTEFLQAQGYRVLRFWDNEILKNTDGVLQRIALALREDHRPAPCLLPRGERDGEKGNRGSSRAPSSCPLPRGGRGNEQERPPMNPSPPSGERAG
jgi:very-short-patch-repair endonuclease